MIFEIIILILGLIGVWIGADLVVEAAKQVARSLNISEAFIGLTVLSIGTSLPEIFSSLLVCGTLNITLLRSGESKRPSNIVGRFTRSRNTRVKSWTVMTSLS